MRHLSVTECMVAEGSMLDFVNSIQQWEQAAHAHQSAPEYHAVLVDPDRPVRVLVMTQFADSETADESEGSGLMHRLMECLMRCTVWDASQRSYDLFYAVGGDGLRAVFGETPRDP